MTLCRESREPTEATRLISLLSIRIIEVGTWNLWTMYETGKTSQVAAEIKCCHLILLGISEICWIQSGQRRLLNGEMLLYSGHEEDKATLTKGEALVLSGPA